MVTRNYILVTKVLPLYKFTVSIFVLTVFVTIVSNNRCCDKRCIIITHVLVTKKGSTDIHYSNTILTNVDQ